MDNSAVPGRPTGLAFIFSGFGLLFRDTFIHTTQYLDNAYFANDEFRDCILYYNGGKLLFMNSNHVVDTDLVLGPRVSRDSPTVRHLLKDFQWRSVETATTKADVR